MTTLRKQLRDRNWVRNSFLVNSDEMDEIDVRNRTFTTARFSFSDTTLGGSLAINPPPQFTRNADLTSPSIFDPKPGKASLTPSSATKGVGRYYHEAIAENSRIVSMRFGVPEFNSLTTFFTGFYNSDMGTLARTGRGNGLIYNFSRAVGYVLPLLSAPIFFISLIGNIERYLSMRPSSKYYYLKPTMPMYWNAVQGIVNYIAVNKGIIPRFLNGDTVNKVDSRYAFTANDIAQFSRLLPEIMMEEGGINVYAMATRAQRLARRMYKTMEQKYEAAAGQGNVNASQVAILNDINQNGLGVDQSGRTPSRTFAAYLEDWLKSSPSKQKTSNSKAADGAPAPDMSTESIPQSSSDVDGFTSFLNAELDDGSAFIAFRVDNDGAVQESFSNTAQESELQGKINNMSGGSRSTNFSFAGGNIGDGLVAQTVQGAIGAVKNVITGLADGVGMSGLAALGGAAFVDIPKHWQSSNAQLPRMNYKFRLVSPYGNKISQLFNLYVPLSMILAAALPLSTGKQSYTSPFILELYDRGHAQTRLGIIDSLSITRGVGNLGFNNSGEAMAIDVSFSVLDLSTVMHMPLGRGFSLTNPLSSIFDDSNSFTDYMAILGSLSLTEQIYTWDKLKLDLTRQMANMNSWFSKAHAANFIGDLWPARMASIFYTGLVNR